MSAEKRLKDLNIILPKSSPPAGSYFKVVVLDGFAGMTLILGAGLYVLYREKISIEKHLEQNQNG